MVHQWKKALFDGATGVLGCGGAPQEAALDKETLKGLHSKIGELTVEQVLLFEKLKPWIGK